MAKSIMKNEKACYFCGSTWCIDKHHVFFGIQNRGNSEKYGLTVYLCHECHCGNEGVHFNKEKNIFLKKKGQEAFERVHGDRNKFMQVFGKNWLD